MEDKLEQIKTLLRGSYLKVNLTHDSKENCYFLNIESSDSQGFTFINLSTLHGYIKIAEILGCTNGDEYSRDTTYYRGGCDTCDYGSSYESEVTLKFW